MQRERTRERVREAEKRTITSERRGEKTNVEGVLCGQVNRFTLHETLKLGESDHRTGERLVLKP